MTNQNVKIAFGNSGFLTFVALAKEVSLFTLSGDHPLGVAKLYFISKTQFLKV